MGLINLVNRITASGRPQGNGGDSLVYRASQGHVDDPWEQRIMELGVGRSVAEIREILYAEEVRAGGSVVDIGIWKGLFQDRVNASIAGLSRRGLIDLRSQRAAE